jgi:hypothetical protein
VEFESKYSPLHVRLTRNQPDSSSSASAEEQRDCRLQTLRVEQEDEECRFEDGHYDLWEQNFLDVWLPLDSVLVA